MRLFLIASAVAGLCLVALAAAQPPIPENYPISTYTPEIQNEEQIWTCPTDSSVVIAVWRDFRLGYRQIGIGRSWLMHDFWIDSLIHPDMQMFMQQSDPCLTVDKDGNFYICVLDYQPSATSIYDSSYISVLKSTDKGVSWTGPVTVVDTLGPYFEDKQFTVVDRTSGPHSGNYYLAWARFPNPNRIMFARSTDGAQTFEDTIIVGPNQDGSACGWGTLDAGQFACPAVGSDGAVYVMWIGGDLNTTTCDYFTALKMVKSVDGGVTFTDPAVIRYTAGNWGEVDGEVDVYNQPVIATDISGGPHDGAVYVAYASIDVDNSLYDYNIEFIRSTDGGASWSDVIYVNDDYVGEGAIYDQFHPWLVTNQEGTLICFWYDQRTDPVNHYKFDAFAAYSFDGGATFTTNHRISSQSIDPDDLKKSGSRQSVSTDLRMETTSGRPPRAGLIAEYIGVTAFNDHINATWTGTVGSQIVFGANWTIPLMKPRLVSPADGASISDPTPTMVWSTSWKEDDDSYRLEVAEDNLFVTVVYVYTGVENQSTYAGTPLVQGEDYFWRVKATRVSDAEVTEYSEVWSFTAVADDCIDTDGDGFGDPWEAGNLCPPDNCPYTPNPAQLDSDFDGIGDACDLAFQFYDTVSTGCTQLAVGNHGNFGRDGDYGATMDYADFGDCDATAELYIYDGSPFITYVSGIDTVLEYTGYGRDTYTDLSGFNPIVPTVDLPDYQTYQSGTFATADQTLALEKTWWAPKHPDSCNFIIQRLRLYSADGSPHFGLNVGEFVDWDIPSDNVVDNYPGWIPSDGMLFLQGSETDGLGCQPNDRRWGGSAMLGAYLNDSCAIDDETGPYGAYLMDNQSYLFPSMGFVPAEQYAMMSTSGYSAYPGVPGAYDYNGVITYFHDLSLAAQDTLVIYAAVISVQNGPIDTLIENLYKAQAWFDGHVSPTCGLACSPPIRGDVNYDLEVLIDIADLVYLVDFMFSSGPEPPCFDEGDVDGSGVAPIDIADLVYLVDYMFNGGPEPPLCP